MNLYIALGSMNILMILILPIHESGIYFHLFVSSSISFFSIYIVFSIYIILSFFEKYNWPPFGSQAGTQSTEPHQPGQSMDINFASCYLLNLFVNSSSFLVESLGSSVYSIMSSVNNDSFTSSFSV